MAQDSAFRRIQSNPDYRKIEATITLPLISDVDWGKNSLSVYHYVGCNGSGFDFEFGFGLEKDWKEYKFYRSIAVGSSKPDWQYIAGYTFNPGSTYRLMIATEDNYIKCYVYNSSGSLLYSNDDPGFPVSGAKANGSGQRVRRVSTLLVDPGGSASVENIRWTTTKVGNASTFVNATSANCKPDNVTSPSGQPWVTATTYNAYYNEYIYLHIRK